MTFKQTLFYRTCCLAALSGSVLLAGCSSLNAPLREVKYSMPDQFAHDASAHVPQERWWQEFNDDHLNQLVETALTINPDIGQAFARMQAANAQLRMQGADRLPQVGIGFDPSRQRTNLPRIPGITDGGLVDSKMITTNYNLGLNVSWEIDLWGRVSALTGAARADYLASAEQLRGMRQSIAAQVVQLYYQIVHDKAQLKLLERTVESLAEMSRQVNNRVNVGVASPADGRLANVSLESARAGMEQQRKALAGNLRQLEIVLGLYPSGSLPTGDELPAPPEVPSAGVPAELLNRRPDVRTAELALIRSGYQLQAAQRSFLPSLSLTGSAGYSSPQFSQLFNSGSFVWSIAGNILQPIFQGGRLVAQVDMVTGQREESIHAYAKTALNALAEVETSLAVETMLTRRTNALHLASSNAQEAERVSFNRYLQGIDPFLNVLEAQQRSLDSQGAEIGAQLAKINNRAALHLALGGGFERELERDTQSVASAPANSSATSTTTSTTTSTSPTGAP